MKIIVPIKQVPETNAVKMDETTGTMIRDGVEAIINPLDLYAIEAAIQLREQHGGKVITISMGPPKAEKALKEAIAMGCDEAKLVSDKAFSGADTWATSYVLSEAVKKIGSYDLLICGERATDGDTGQVGPGVAAFLDLPVATYVSKIEKVSEKSFVVHRITEEGYEILQIELPAVLTVVKEISNPRLPTLRGKQKAKKTEIPVYDAEALDVSSYTTGQNGSPTRVVKIFRPKVTRECKKITALDEKSIKQAVNQLVTFLQTKELLNRR
ncbi:MAG: electron transfer flavoprotein subunit beta/FixA family protein [Planctomycetota bacterium]|jgi:electron transfer flavoprotein beta subunit